MKTESPRKHRRIRMARIRAANDAPNVVGRDAHPSDRARNQCAYCGETPERLTRDHVVPLSVGGGGGLVNLVRACAPCNVAKANCVPAGIELSRDAKYPVTINWTLLRHAVARLRSPHPRVP